jgi:hypothetical protein
VAAWDLGVADSTAVWFVQCVGRERRLVHYYERCQRLETRLEVIAVLPSVLDALVMATSSINTIQNVVAAGHQMNCFRFSACSGAPFYRVSRGLRAWYPVRGQYRGPIGVRLTNGYAANSSSNAFASFRSRVSNPSVNHP